MSAIPYGQELILDLADCDARTFTRESLTTFFETLCEQISMERCDLHFWDYADDPEGYAEAPAHLKGTSAIQFITTSNITIHTLETLQKVFLNIFSCAPFDATRVVEICTRHFKGVVRRSTLIPRW